MQKLKEKSIQSKSSTIVHIVERLAPGGIETLVIDLVGRGGVGVHIFSLQGTTEQLTDQWGALAKVRSEFEAFNRLPGLRPGLVVQLARRLSALRAHLVVVHHAGPLFYGGAAARLVGVPQLIHVEHDIWHYEDRRSQLLLKLCEHAFRPDHFAVSEPVAERLASIIPDARISIVPPGIDTERFLPRNTARMRTYLALDPSWFIIGTAGRLEAVKGHIFLIEAMQHLPRNVHAVIVGDGRERVELEEEARRIGVHDRVHFLGHRDDLEKVLPAFDVYCLPSLKEGLPRSVLEAQSCDLPVVATDVGSLSQALCPETGYLVRPSDPIALADALIRHLKQPRQIGLSREFVKKQFPFASTLSAFGVSEMRIS